MKNTIKIIVILLFTGNVWSQSSILDQIRNVERTFEWTKLNGINSVYSDFSPVIYNDKVVFASDREFDMLATGENWWKRRPLLNLFSTDITVFSEDSLIFSDCELFESDFMSDSHTGPITFSKDGKIAVFTQVNSKRSKGDPKVKIHKPMLFYSLKNDNIWSKPKRLPFVNVEYSYGHGFFADDGQTLFFTSDIEGGFGGDDLYRTTFDGTNWSKPVNLGNTINSSRDEVFPCYFEKVLYFSSDKTGGVGGLDLYMAKINKDGSIGTPQILAAINSAQDDFGMVFRNGTSGFFSSNREGGMGADDIYLFNVKESINLRTDFIAGQFTHRKLNDDPADALKVLLLDDDGNPVMETTTDKNGEFLFQNLDAQDSYIIKIDGAQDLQLVIYDENGEKKAYLLSDYKGEFVYKRLDQQHVGTLSLIDEADIREGLADLNGQFIYENLPGKSANGLKVLLVDENGEIVYTSTTDRYGNFEFSDLPMDENFMVRMEKLDDDLTLVIYNNDDNVTAILRMNGQGDFIFRKLDQKYHSDLKMLELDDEDLLSDLQGSIFGQFEPNGKPGSIEGGLEFEVINDEGKIVAESRTDEKGMFRLNELPLTESYIFRIKDEDGKFDENMSLSIMNRQGKKVAHLDQDKQGYFVYTPLGLSGPINLTNMNMDNTDFETLIKVPTIYYETGSYSLSVKAKAVLDKLVTEMKHNTAVKIEINSYADSRASEEFNLTLSGKRTASVINYLKSQGISDSRLGGNAYGESKLLNDCGNGVDCPESLHQLNRRSEVRLYTIQK